MTKTYRTAHDFRNALEEKLKNESRKTGVALQRERKEVAFDALLARLFLYFPKDLLLKGGYALELRLDNARATKDIDLVLKKSPHGTTGSEEQILRSKLQEAVQNDLGDYFEFLIGQSNFNIEAVPYGGFRFPVEARLAGRKFDSFPIDIAISSLFLNPIDKILSKDRLGFAGIKYGPFPAISKEQQFAEKLHAYTLPREIAENSRVKDLIDMGLLMSDKELKKDILKIAITKVFEHRGTHPVPTGFIEPPSSWNLIFTKLRIETGLDMNTDQAVALIAEGLCLPIFVREEKSTEPTKNIPCHFCGTKALSWQSNRRERMGSINETEDTYDYNCPKCHSYRITGLFKEITNFEINQKDRDSWANYLQTRTVEEGKNRILISRLSNSIPRK